MKTLIRLMPIIPVFLGVIGFSSCEKKNIDNSGWGELEVSLNLPDETSFSKSGTSVDSGMVSYQLMVSIENMEGNLVMSDSLIPLYTFGTGFVSENIELKTGEYKLTKFMIINPSGAVVFAAPITGAPLAYLVNRPLPLPFNIFPDQVTKIVPEVLLVGNQTPDQFGYANFGMQIIKPLHFWAVCILDNPLSMAPTQLTTAKLTVYSENGWHYTFNLEASTNHLIIRGGSSIYYFLLEKEGYKPLKIQFTVRELMATSRDYPLILKIPSDRPVWLENFEAYSANTFPNTWVADGNGTDLSKNHIDNSIFYKGEKSLKLFGAIGSCWAAIAYHTLTITPPFELEFAVRNGDETLSGCNPDRALVGLNTETSWTSPSQRYFVRFYRDGKIYGSGGKELGSYLNNTWYLVKIRYERISTSQIKLSYWINNNYLGSESLGAISEENLLKNLEIQVLEGSAWFDDIKILK